MSQNPPSNLQTGILQNSHTSRDAADWKVRHLVDGVNAIVWEADARTWQFDFVSEEAEAMLGYPLENWLTQPDFWVSHIHPDDREEAVDCYLKCTSEDADHHFDYRARTASGAYIWLRDIVRVLTDDNGKPTKIRGVMIDIDAQKRAEEALRDSELQRERSEERFRTLVESAPICIHEVDIDGRLISMNAAGLRMVEAKGEDDIFGTAYADFVAESDRAQVSKLIQDAVAGHAVEFEFRAIVNGNQRVFSSSLIPLLDASGRVAKLMGVSEDITRRVDMEQALRESEQRFRTIFEQVAVGVALINTKTGRFVRVNRKHEELFGFLLAEMHDMTYMEFTVEGLQEYLDNIEKLKRGEIPDFTMETCMACRDGSDIWVNLTVSPTWFPGDEPSFHIVIVEDITARKKIEQALRQSEKSLARAQEIARLGNWEFDLANDELTGSAETFRIFGIADDGTKHQLAPSIEKFVHPDDQELVNRALEQAISTGKPSPTEFRHISASHGIRHLRADAELTRGSDGSVAKVFGTLMDVTEFKASELALRESESKFRVISENCPAMIAIFQSGAIKYANDKLSSILGYSPQEIPEMDFLHVVDPEYRELVRERNQRRLLGEDVLSRYEVKLRTKTGGIRWVDFTAGVVEYESKPAVLGIGLDITERRSTEERLHQREMELAHVSRLTTMGEMVAGIAHEISQPLSAISSFADACYVELNKLDSSQTGSLKAWTQHIGQQAIRCGDIIRRLRGYVKQPKLDETCVEINDIIQESIALLRNETRQSVIAVECDLVQPSPSVRGNPIELQQVIVNLLSNGQESMNQIDSDQRSLSVRSSVLMERVHVIVEDSGPGISPSDMNSIFEAFFTTKAEGMGMGLAISRSIIERHEGQLWAENRTPHGAALHVELPIA